jgi:hypothetical protein
VAFTYSDDLALDKDRVRFALGDTVLRSGPKPADANFSDAEIAGVIVIEGTWQRATAALFEALASLWARHVTFGADGMSASLSDVAEQYRASAKEWRQKHGGGSTSGSQAVIRADGYSQDIDNIEVDYL